MALTKILDGVEPAVYFNYEKEYKPELYTLLESSAISAPSAEIMAQMTSGGRIIDMPFWQDVDRLEPEILSDDDAIDSVAAKITAVRETARKLYWGRSWSQADLAGVVLTGLPKDPLQQIYDYIINYWRAKKQDAIVKVLDGVAADNIANDAGDMRYTVYSDIATPLAANKISPTAVNSARVTMGEMMSGLDTIIMHSKVYVDALNQENISFVQPSNLPFSIPVFNGMKVAVCDACSISTGFTNTPRYRSYIVGPGVVALAEHMPEMALEPYREPRKGRGGGVTSLFSRRHALIHPKGFRFTSTAVADKGPSFTELATATNWDRVRLRKNIRLAYLDTN